ncbi:hypothetical protein [Flagellimonas hadalis]|uniref:Uncharacterized protein n=1 Tax=Flagellimonas hadalis TaxID=2597517 RepID=A0A5N5IL81_9FLAO|nr:hypothetical protein [Allomuricauda hadalis]KAB5484207.1 hypothetical protein FOT42_016795 [Allomuricauda hadalis]
MKKENLSNLIVHIINSNIFKQRLSSISSNYPNLKQENLIRNYILEELNKGFVNTNFKAFAEHPRLNTTRVDLGIVDATDQKNPFKVEFKYQFSKDNFDLSDYGFVIRRDFEERKSDLFILTIAHWDIQKKIEFDKHWGIDSNLSRFVSKSDAWKTNILECFDTFENTKLNVFDKIEVDSPFDMEYHFYMLRRL